MLLYSFEGITAFSTAPLYLAVIMGLVFLLLAILVALTFVMRLGEMSCQMFIVIYPFRSKIFRGKKPYCLKMWGTPLVVTLICLVGGIQLFCIGILGQYLATDVHSYLSFQKQDF